MMILANFGGFQDHPPKKNWNQLISLLTDLDDNLMFEMQFSFIAVGFKFW